MNNVNRTTRQLINTVALAILAAYALTTTHHIYAGLFDRAPNRLRVPGIMAIPSLITLGALYRYKRTASGAALATSSTVAVLAWVVLSGLLHGGYAHAYKDILFLVDGPPELYYPLNPEEHYPPDDVFFEITGVLEMVTGYFIALFTYRLIRDRQQRTAHPQRKSERPWHDKGRSIQLTPQAATPHRPRDGALDPVAPGVLAAHLGSREARALGSSVSNMRTPGFAAATSRSAEAASNHMGDAPEGGTEPLQDIDEQP